MSDQIIRRNPVKAEKIDSQPEPQPILRSPVPDTRIDQDKKPKELSFTDAIREIVNGRHVTRLDWGTNNIYCLLKDTFLMIHLESDNKFHPWTVNDGDMTALDWVVLPEQSAEVK